MTSHPIGIVLKTRYQLEIIHDWLVCQSINMSFFGITIKVDPICLLLQSKFIPCKEVKTMWLN